MKLKGIITEDFCNYKLPSMFLITSMCDWKCCKEKGIGISLCQNSSVALSPTIDIDNNTIYEFYADNDITKAVVVGGLEPFLQFNELEELISYFRCCGEKCDFVIYTGYYPYEIQDKLDILSCYDNIVVKFGRYDPNLPSIYDETLGITLASSNQYAKRIS